MPTTPFTQTINYGQRVLMNEPGRPIPLAWRVSKYESLQPLGITRLTFTQEQASVPEDCGQYGIANFCPHSEHSGVKHDLCAHCQLEEPIYIDAGLEMPIQESTSGRITYTGKPTIRVGGSYKTLTAEYWDSVNREFISYNAYWKITFDTCALNVHPNGSSINISKATSGFDIEIDGDEVRCFIDEKDILKLKIKSDENSLQLSCAPLYSMVGKQLLVEANDFDGSNHAETIVEVIS